MNRLLGRAVRLAVITSLALVLPARTLLSQARTGTISGRVTEAVGGAPLASAQVTITGTNIGGLTNAEGRYTLRNVPSGAVVVRAARIGYAEVVRNLNVAAGDNATLDLALTKVALALTPIVTTATGEIRRLEVPNQISQIDASKQIENSQVTNVADLLVGKAAGVQVLQGSGVNAGSRIRIRGT